MWVPVYESETAGHVSIASQMPSYRLERQQLDKGTIWSVAKLQQRKNSLLAADETVKYLGVQFVYFGKDSGVTDLFQTYILPKFNHTMSIAVPSDNVLNESDLQLRKDHKQISHLQYSVTLHFKDSLSPPLKEDLNSGLRETGSTPGMKLAIQAISQSGLTDKLKH